MDPLGSNLAFIVGHYKSGSSWLAYLLCLHPSIRGLSETHIFRYSADANLHECTKQLYSTVAWSGGGLPKLPRHRLAKILRPFRRRGQSTLTWRERPTTLLDLSLLDQFRLRRRLLDQPDLETYRKAFFRYLYQVLESPTYLLEKTPTNIPFVPEVRRLFPECKMVAVYRDGRDVAVSDKFHRRNEYAMKQDFSETVRRWRSAIETQLQYEEPYQIFSLSYEELLADTAGVTTRLLQFLDLDHHPAIVADMVHRSSFEFITGRKPGREEGSSFFRKGIAGDWKNHFTEKELATFSEIGGELLVTLGYERSGDWRSWEGLP